MPAALMTDFRLVDALSATLAKAFATVLVVDVDRYDNSMIFATNETVSLHQFAHRLPGDGGYPVWSRRLPVGRSNMATFALHPHDRHGLHG